MNNEFARLVGEHLVSEDAKIERVVLMNKSIFWACVLGAAAFLVLNVAPALWSKAWAEEIPLHFYEDERVTLKLFAAPCDNARARTTAANSPLSSLVHKLKKATSNWLVVPYGFRMDFAGCWVEYTFRGEQGYAVAFEDEEIRFFSVKDFKRTKGKVSA